MDKIFLEAYYKMIQKRILLTSTIYFGLFLILSLFISSCHTVVPLSTNLDESEIKKETQGSSLSSPKRETTLTILYTNDEHGWIEGEDAGQGAAELDNIWQDYYKHSDEILILSGGDNWTGPAISTWFKGEGTIQVMNEMGYSASAVGNHEFDFGVDIFKERALQANFPYLAANIRYKKDGSFPLDIGIKPYSILELGDLHIGLVGLGNADTPSVTNPKNVRDFEFLDYSEVLREIVPLVWEEGADLIFVPSHLCTWELIPLARDVADLGITLFGGGHCHEELAEIINGSIILSGGSYFKSFAFVELRIDLDDYSVNVIDTGVVENSGGSPSPEVAEIISEWKAKTDAELDITVGYLSEEIPKRSAVMEALITESWLQAYPANFALTNWGGMRDKLPAGEIKISDIISVMPFENVLVEVELTGEQLLKILAFGAEIPPVGGLHIDGGKWIINKTGDLIDPIASYSLITTDFLYAGGDDYTMLAEYDPVPYDTSISWREPVVDWIKNQNSSSQNPLDTIIEQTLMR